MAEASLHSRPLVASVLWPWQTHTRLAWYKHTLRTEHNGFALIDATGVALQWDPNEADLWFNLTSLLSLAGETIPASHAFERLLRVNPPFKAQAVAAAAKANPTGGKEHHHGD